MRIHVNINGEYKINSPKAAYKGYQIFETEHEWFDGWITVDKMQLPGKPPHLLIQEHAAAPKTAHTYILEFHMWEAVLFVADYMDEGDPENDNIFERCEDDVLAAQDQFFGVCHDLIQKGDKDLRQLEYCAFMECDSPNYTHASAYFGCIYSGKEIPDDND